MLTWLTKWFKRKSESEEIEVKDKPGKNDEGFTALSAIFSTHQTKRYESVIDMQQLAIPVKPHQLKEVKSVSGKGMDFGSSASTGAKNAFVFGQQRIPEDLFAWYVSQGFIGYQACGIIAQQWLVNKACTVKGEDAVRNGYNVAINDGTEVDAKILSYITKADKRFKVKTNLERASKFNNVFGIRHVLFVVNSNDEGYYEKPFNADGIKPGTYKGITQIDPYWITPLLDSSAVAEPESIDFYDPTYWVISGRKFHHTHFVILRGPEVSDILKPSYIYGGLPLTQLIMERAYGAERSANEAPILLMTKRLNVRKMDLSLAVAQPEKFQEALAMQAEIRDNHGFLAAGKDEEVEQLETALADVDSVIMTQYQLVAALANMPATRLIETSPKGFNATGEYEAKNYQQVLETEQDDLTPIVERHHTCLMKSEVTPKFNTDFEIDVDWNPADMPTTKELAELNESKSRTDTAYINVGAIGPDEIRDRLISDQDSGYSGLEAINDSDYDIDDLVDENTEQGEITDEPGLAPLKQDAAAKSAAINAIKNAEDSESIGQDVLKEEGGKWYVYSESGKKLGGPYSNKKKARNRLREIEHFKQQEGK